MQDGDREITASGRMRQAQGDVGVGGLLGEHWQLFFVGWVGGPRPPSKCNVNYRSDSPCPALCALSFFFSLELAIIPQLQINSSFLLSSLLFWAGSRELKSQFGRASVIPVLFRFLISSVAHAGKQDTSVSKNKSRPSWKGGLQCKQPVNLSWAVLELAARSAHTYICWITEV